MAFLFQDGLSYMGTLSWDSASGSVAYTPEIRGGVIPDGAFLGHGEATHHAKEAWDYGVVSDFIATAIFSAW
jgi:hypothetical protein